MIRQRNVNKSTQRTRLLKEDPHSNLLPNQLHLLVNVHSQPGGIISRLAFDVTHNKEHDYDDSCKLFEESHFVIGNRSSVVIGNRSRPQADMANAYK